MPFGFIKDVQNSGSGTSLAVTVPAVKVGYLVVVNLKFSGTVTSLTVTDNASTPNTYASAVGPINQGTNNLRQYYGVAVVGGATSISASWTGSVSVRITVDIFSGGKLTNATVFDKAASNTGAAGTSSTVTIAPTNAGELVVGAIIWSGTPSAPTAGTNYLLSNANTSMTTEYRAVATTSETVPISWTGSNNWTEVAGAYISASVTTDFLYVF